MSVKNPLEPCPTPPVAGSPGKSGPKIRNPVKVTELMLTPPPSTVPCFSFASRSLHSLTQLLIQSAISSTKCLLEVFHAPKGTKSHHLPGP